MEFGEDQNSINKNFERTKSGKMKNLFLFVIKILGLAFACWFMNVFEMGLWLVDSEVETMENLMRIRLDFLSVVDVLIFVMARTPGVKGAIFTVLDFDDNGLGGFHAGKLRIYITLVWISFTKNEAN